MKITSSASSPTSNSASSPATTTPSKRTAAVIPVKEVRLEKLTASAANVDAFIEKAKRYTEIPELTGELLRLFIEGIEVGERGEKYSRTATQSIRIVYGTSVQWPGMTGRRSWNRGNRRKQRKSPREAMGRAAYAVRPITKGMVHNVTL